MKATPKAKRTKKPEPPLILIPHSSTNDVYPGIDHNYFPDEADEVVWCNDGSYTRVSAKCKGCHQEFETQTNDQLQLYLLHCIQLCDPYKSLNLIRHCYPCNKYCLNEEAFLHHSTDLDCPAHEYLTFKRRN